MALPVWLNNLWAYSLQISILASAGTLLACLFRLRMPRVMHWYWQLLLLASLLLPCLQKWEHPKIVITVPQIETFTASAIAVPASALPVTIERARPDLWQYASHLLFGGIALRLLWLGIGFLRLRLLQRKSHLFSEERTIVQDMQWRTGVRVTVRLSSVVHSPVTYGLRSPTVLLPLSFQKLSEPCKQAILCHELMHVRRCDWIVILAEEFIRSLFWFHPAIWWLLNRSQLSREQAVDQEVVRIIGMKQHYLDSLLEFAGTHQHLRTAPAALFLKEHHLVERVALLLREVSMSRVRLVFSMAGIIALLITTLSLAAEWFPLIGEPVYAQTLTASPAPLEQQSSVPERPLIAAVLPPVAPVIAPSMAPPPAPQQEEQPVPVERQPIRGGMAAESKLIYRVDPVYPELAKRAGISGDVILMITIDEQGIVRDAQVRSGDSLLVEAAVAAVKQWRYSPTLLSGNPVPVIATVTVRFALMDPNDTRIVMDNSGNLNADWNQILQTKGTVHITINPGTLYGVANSTVQNLLQQGLQRLEINSSLYAFYQGILYYSGPADLSAAANDTISKAFSDTVRQNQNTPMRFSYRIFISDTGDVAALQRLGNEYPDFEAAVLQAHVDPVIQGGYPVPYARTISLFRGDNYQLELKTNTLSR